MKMCNNYNRKGVKMNKIKIFVVFGCIFLLTGCIKYNTDMKINDDKSIDLHMRYGTQIEFVDNSEDSDDNYIDEDLDIENDEEIEEEEKKETEKKEPSYADIDTESYKFLKNHGYSIEEYSEKLDNGNTSTGIDIIKRFNSLDDITSEEKVTVDFIKLFSNEKNFDDSKFFYKENNMYNANFIFNFEPEEGSDNVDLQSYADMFDLKYSITFPNDVKYITSNANEKSNDGKTLTWNFEVGKVNEVNFSFSYERQMSEIDKIIIFVCLGVIGFSILLIIIVSLTKLGKKKIEIEELIDENENNTEESNK